MDILVTGAFGFVGQHLAKELVANVHAVHAFDISSPKKIESTLWQSVHFGNICNINDLIKAIKEVKPDACCHLAGMAFVPDGWAMPQQLFEINLIGTINLIEAVRATLADQTKILFVSSAEVYGTRSSPAPLSEESLLNPENPYAVSKASADIMTLLYAKKGFINAVVARPYNHTGPGQSPKFAIPSFATQLLAIRNKKVENKIYVGNLKSIRYFTDVRDTVRAYRLLLEKGVSGNAYNISTSQETSLEKILQTLCEIIDVKPEIIVDPARFRPQTTCPKLDITKIEKHTGWCPAIPLSQTLRDIVHTLKQDS